MSADNKTLCIWFATDTNKDKNKVTIGKIQVACFDFEKILSYFDKNKSKTSLSFQKMDKKWCYYSCEQIDKKDQVRPSGSNQGIAVSNRYKGKVGNKEVYKNKVYFTGGNEEKGKPLRIGMMTIYKKGNDLEENYNYSSQLTISVSGLTIDSGKKVVPYTKKMKAKGIKKKAPKMEIEGLQIVGNYIYFILTPSTNTGKTKVLKSRQYIYRIKKNNL